MLLTVDTNTSIDVVENNALGKDDEKRLGLRSQDVFDASPILQIPVLDGDGDPSKGGGGIKGGKPVTEHTIVSSGKAPKTSKPNSIYEVSRADGSKSITYYDSKGNMFSREDYGQQRTHGSLGYDSNGHVPPHEHKVTYNERGYVDGKYYREIDKSGNPVGPWISEK
ncbi:hypothetical protein [Pluralibacter gergoviae]|uniref:hypothetical protein n=1 Tax=Pluralibacter gergoviae TaxID=61647 RepID=UPI00155EFFDE|nr:hypothetical protein [Pluralibacter gergoviae]